MTRESTHLPRFKSLQKLVLLVDSAQYFAKLSTEGLTRAAIDWCASNEQLSIIQIVGGDESDSLVFEAGANVQAGVKWDRNEWLRYKDDSYPAPRK